MTQPLARRRFAGLRAPRARHRRLPASLPGSVAPLRPATYREARRLPRPVAVAGAVLVLGVLPVSAALGRHPAPPAVRTSPAGASSSSLAPAAAAVRDAAADPRADQHRGAPRTAPRAARAAVRRPVPVAMRTRVVERVTFAQRGRASWYGPGFHGRRTASGERFDTGEMTAAHRTLPFGTRARVCTRRRCVTVRINDRGPFVRGRVVDLSHAAARRLGITHTGVARVTVSVVRTRSVREPVPMRAAPAVRRSAPAAASAPPGPTAASVNPITAPVSVAAAASEDGANPLGLLALASVAALFWIGPVVAKRRRRERLDFLR